MGRLDDLVGESTSRLDVLSQQKPPSRLEKLVKKSTLAEQLSRGVTSLARATRETIEPPTTIEASERLLSPTPGAFGLGQFAEERAAEVEQAAGGKITEQLIDTLPESKFGQKFPKTTAAVGAAAEVARPIIPGSLRPSALPGQFAVEQAARATFGLVGRAGRTVGKTKVGKVGIQKLIKLAKRTPLLKKFFQKKPQQIKPVIPNISQVPPQQALVINPAKQISEEELNQAVKQAPREIGVGERLQTELTQSGGTTLQKQGPTGEIVRTDLMSYRRNWQVESGKSKQTIVPELEKLLPAEKEAFVTLVNEGKLTQAATPIVRSLAKTAKQLTDVIGVRLENLSQDLGIKVQTAKGERFFIKRKNFFPNELDLDVLRTPEGRLDEIRHLLRTKQVTDPIQAADIVDLAIERGSKIIDEDTLKIAGLKFPRLAKELKGERTFQFKNIIRDPAIAYDRFFDRIHKSIARLETYGKNDEKLIQDLLNIAKTGGDIEAATKITDSVLGRVAKDDINKAVGYLTAIQGVKLSLSFIQNATQRFINPFVRSKSLLTTLRGWGKATKNREGATALAERSGAIANQAHREYVEVLTGNISGRNLSPKLNKFLKFSLSRFKVSEVSNRIVSVTIGQEYLERNLVPKFLKNTGNKQTRKELLDLGIQPDALLKQRGKLTEDQLLGAVNEFSRQTQFGHDALELPTFWTSAYGKLLTQYKGFAFNQAKLLKNMAKIAPMSTSARYATLSVLIGIPVNKLRKLVRGQLLRSDKKETTFLQEAIDGFLTIGGIGLYSDAVRSAEFGEKGILGLLGGPTAGTVASLGVPAAKGITGALKLDPEQVTDAAREFTRQSTRQFVPFVGPAISEFFRKKKKKDSLF